MKKDVKNLQLNCSYSLFHFSVSFGADSPTLKFSDIEILRHWNSPTLKFSDIEILRHWNLTEVFWFIYISKFRHGSKLIFVKTVLEFVSGCEVTSSNYIGVSSRQCLCCSSSYVKLESADMLLCKNMPHHRLFLCNFSELWKRIFFRSSTNSPPVIRYST